MRFDAMIQLLSINQLGHPAQVRLDGEALVPSASLTIFDIVCRSTLFAKTQIGQRNRLAVIADCQGAKYIIWFVGGVPGPVDHFTRIVNQPRQLDPDNPATIRFAFFANLLLAAAFAARMDQLDSVGVHNRKESWVSEKWQHILGMVAQQA